MASLAAATVATPLNQEITNSTDLTSDLVQHAEIKERDFGYLVSGIVRLVLPWFGVNNEVAVAVGTLAQVSIKALDLCGVVEGEPVDPEGCITSVAVAIFTVWWLNGQATGGFKRDVSQNLHPTASFVEGVYITGGAGSKGTHNVTFYPIPDRIQVEGGWYHIGNA